MIRILLCCMMLFQAASQTATKPVIDNDRVAVWDTTSPAAQPLDSVVVSLDGAAAWAAKGQLPTLSGHLMVINLKQHPVAPIENKSGFPLAFPRPGTKKLLENDRVIVWDSTWTPGVTGPMHFHDKDVVVVFLKDGDLKSTTPDGKEVILPHKPASVIFNPRDRVHKETLVRGEQRAIITELK